MFQARKIMGTFGRVETKKRTQQTRALRHDALAEASIEVFHASVRCVDRRLVKQLKRQERADGRDSMYKTIVQSSARARADGIGPV